MKQYLNKEVVMTFSHPVAFPDGSAANLVQGVITEHHPDEHWIIINGILVNYQNNPLMSICLSAAEQLKNQ
jgi:mannitol/fructose-specific phosphotransferase system IIA component